MREIGDKIKKDISHLNKKDLISGVANLTILVTQIIEIMGLMIDNKPLKHDHYLTKKIVVWILEDIKNDKYKTIISLCKNYSDRKKGAK